MCLLQALAHQTERFAEARFERRLQLFIYSLAHLLEFGGVVGLERVQALIDHAADRFELLLLIALHTGSRGKKAGEQFVRFFAGTGELMGNGCAQGFGTLFRLSCETLNTDGDFFPKGAALVALPLLGACEIVAEAGFKTIV